MKASKLKAIGENLGRFASVRENAPYPTDRILVQSRDGVLKMVAIATHGTLVATISESSQDYRAIIGARDFLTYVKNLSAKEEIEITPASDDWERGINIGKRFFERIDTKVPAQVIMPKVEVQDGGYVDIPDSKELGKMADSLSAGWSNGVQFAGAIVTGHKANIECAIWDSYKYGTRTLSGDYELFGWCEATLISSLRGIGPYRIAFDPANSIVIIRAEGYTCYGNYNFLATSVPVGAGAGLQTPTHYAVVDRVAFKKELRNHVGLDKHERVVLRLNEGTLTVHKYEEDTEEWAASGRFLIQLMDSSSTPRIGFGLREIGGPISMKVDAWQIELAPVKQLKKKSIATPKTIPQGIYAD